jgi:hypothetical protein
MSNFKEIDEELLNLKKSLPIVSAGKPTSVPPGTLWKDSSSVEESLWTWDGTHWVGSSILRTSSGNWTAATPNVYNLNRVDFNGTWHLAPFDWESGTEIVGAKLDYISALIYVDASNSPTDYLEFSVTVRDSSYLKIRDLTPILDSKNWTPNAIHKFYQSNIEKWLFSESLNFAVAHERAGSQTVQWSVTMQHWAWRRLRSA